MQGDLYAIRTTGLRSHLGGIVAVEAHLWPRLSSRRKDLSSSQSRQEENFTFADGRFAEDNRRIPTDGTAI